MKSAVAFAAAFALGCVVACQDRVDINLPQNSQPHIDADWFTHRAAALGITEEAARLRDQQINEDVPFETATSPEMQQEAAALWGALCAACHGAYGQPPEIPGTTPKPAFGTTAMGMGFFFGGDKMRAGLYKVIAEGKVDEAGNQTMRSWRGIISREQMWALVAYIERL